MKVYFSHGQESGPWGIKIKRLSAMAKEFGCEVDSVDYTDLKDPELRVERLLEVLAKEAGSYVLVGSSMGAYVSLVASETAEAKAVFLIAPALYMPTFKKQRYHSNCAHIEIVHGWSDEIILAEHSIKYAREANCTLHLISGDHGLNSSLDVVASLFEQFLRRAMCA
jgi:alpha/beta superfamily hydrolase